MSHGEISNNGSPPYQIFMLDTKYNFQSNGHTVQNRLCH